jgi:hypothetical protein
MSALMLAKPYALKITDDSIRIYPNVYALADILFRYGITTGLNADCALCIHSRLA